MKDIVSYILIIVLTPAFSAIIDFLLLFVFSPVLDYIKERFSMYPIILNVCFLLISVIGLFVSLFFVDKIFRYFDILIVWKHIVIVLIAFIYNDLRRILKTKGESFEIFNSLGDIIGIILAGIYLI